MKVSMILGLVLLSVMTCFAGDLISLRADIWDPYNGDPASDRPGFIIEATKAVFEKAGYLLDYQVKGWTWDRSMEEAKNGKIDGVIGAAKSDAPDFVFPEEAFCKQRMTFFVKKSNPWRFSGVESLSSIKLGIISGYTYEDQVDGYIKKNQANEEAIQIIKDDNALELNIKKLAAGRIGATIEDAAVFNTKAKALGMTDQFETAGVAGDGDDIFIAFTPAKDTSKKYAGILAAGIKEMKASGDLQKLLDKYGIGK
jgi:polar amino acid transport system substrate-binding protein